MARRLRYCSLVPVTAFLLCAANLTCAQTGAEKKARQKSVSRNEITLPLGFLGASYNFAGTNSQLAGLDGLFSLNRQTTFTWQALGSTSVDNFFFADTGQTQHRRENGFGYAFDLTKNGRNLLVDLSGIGRTLFFRTAVGFQTRVNYNSDSLFGQYTTNPRPKAKIISFQIYDKPSILYDWQGRRSEMRP